MSLVASTAACVTSVESSAVVASAPRTARARAMGRKACINRVNTRVIMSRWAAHRVVIAACAQGAKNAHESPNQDAKSNGQDITENVFHQNTALQSGLGHNFLIRGQDV
ncbi:hypothetical protein ACFMBG_02300 [Leisingera sp. D0M16]|uniref:hypothetical protein n=1 Tax=Leisingera coralii TaxID=3351347 RepID=UPI003B76478B